MTMQAQNIPAIDWGNSLIFRKSGAIAAYTPKNQTLVEYPGPEFRHPRVGPTYEQQNNEIVWYLRWPGFDPFTGEAKGWNDYQRNPGYVGNQGRHS